MKETKPYWYHNMAYSIEPYFVSLDFPNLFNTCTNSSNFPRHSPVVNTYIEHVHYVKPMILSYRIYRIYSYSRADPGIFKKGGAPHCET